VEEATDAIYNQDMTDMADLLVNLIKEERYVQGQELVNVSNYGGFLENGKPTWCEQEYYEKKKVVSKEHVDYVLAFLVSFSLGF